MKNSLLYFIYILKLNSLCCKSHFVHLRVKCPGTLLLNHKTSGDLVPVLSRNVSCLSLLSRLSVFGLVKGLHLSSSGGIVFTPEGPFVSFWAPFPQGQAKGHCERANYILYVYLSMYEANYPQPYRYLVVTSNLAYPAILFPWLFGPGRGC